MWELNDYRDTSARTDRDERDTQLHGMSGKLKGVSSWGKRDILVVAGVVLFVSGIGIGVWISPVGIAMLLVGILLAGIAANERLISWACIGALGLYLTVTTFVLLFNITADATDPGANWLEHISWFFRVAGVLLSLPRIGTLSLVVENRRRVYSELPAERPPSDLPAAAVSELVYESQRPRTPYVIVMEMLQAGTLEAVSEGGAPPVHRLTSKPGRKQKWEQTASDALPQEPISRFNLLKRLDEPDLGLRQQIHEHLQQRGLLRRDDSRRALNAWFAALAASGSVLMGVGLALWIVRLGPAWTVALVMIAAAYTAWAWIGLRQIEKLNKFTAAGIQEIRQWRGFGTHLESSEFEPEKERELGRVDSLIPYALALNRLPIMQEKPEPEISEEPRSDLAAGIAASWRESKTNTVAGFASGYYLSSWLYPGEGAVERAFNGIFDLSEFSATFGAFDAFGGGVDVGGGDGDFEGLGDFLGLGDGDGDFDFDF